MSWKFDRDRPIYAQLVEQLQREIVSGRLSPGSRLSSVRDLATGAGVNPNTMQRALAELEQLGLVYTQRTNGRYVTEDATLLEHTRHHLATEILNGFWTQMAALGYTKETCLELMKEEENGG